MRRFKIMLLIVMLSFVGLNVISSGAVYAQAPTQIVADLHADACSGLSQIDSSQGCGSNGDGIKDIIRSIVNILSYLVGVIAIIMVIVSGFRFITSGGDTSRASSARSALVYALVGLAIAALAQFLVHFALSTADSATSIDPSSPCRFSDALDKHPGIKNDDTLCVDQPASP